MFIRIPTTTRDGVASLPTGLPAPEESAEVVDEE